MKVILKKDLKSVEIREWDNVEVLEYLARLKKSGQIKDIRFI